MIRRIEKPVAANNRTSLPAQSEILQAESVALAELRAIYQNTCVGVCMVNRDLRYIKINERLARMNGRSTDEHLGRPVREMLPSLADALEPILRKILETGEPVEKLIMHDPKPQPSSATHAAEVSFRAVKDADGQIIGVNAIVVDITEREEALHRYTEELEESVVERTATLQESVQSLEGVLYHVAHDLRAPLRAMQGLSTLLLEQSGIRLDEEGRDYATRIVTAASRMDALIHDLLAYGRLGHVDLPAQKVSLEKVTKYVLDWMCDEIQEKNGQVEIQHPLPTVCANDVVLQQMIINLLSNALKFVAPGVAPRVRIWSESMDGKIRLWIQDNGIGIEAEHQERIFRVFERLHRPEDFPGTGIGLAIVQKGMERMGGRVGVESQPDRGSKFWIELPAA